MNQQTNDKEAAEIAPTASQSELIAALGAETMLVWSEEKPADDLVHYNHIEAQTPFGRFLITWKGWKEYDSPTIDETPWGEFGGCAFDVESAKNIAQTEYTKRVMAAVGL